MLEIISAIVGGLYLLPRILTAAYPRSPAQTQSCQLPASVMLPRTIATIME
jgi:hypothetical protein